MSCSNHCPFSKAKGLVIRVLLVSEACFRFLRNLRFPQKICNHYLYKKEYGIKISASELFVLAIYVYLIASYSSLAKSWLALISWKINFRKFRLAILIIFLTQFFTASA